jgi:hypothetical protein
MLYRITYNDEPIGTSRLEFRDSAMAVAFGKFDALPSYDAVRSVFLMFTSAQSGGGQAADAQKLSQYYAARDDLRLVLEEENGRRIRTAYIHIVDWGPENGTDLEVEVQVNDEEFWLLL